MGDLADYFTHPESPEKIDGDLNTEIQGQPEAFIENTSKPEKVQNPESEIIEKSIPLFLPDRFMNDDQETMRQWPPNGYNIQDDLGLVRPDHYTMRLNRTDKNVYKK